MTIPNRKRRTSRSREPDMSSWSDEDRKQYQREKALRTPIAEMKLPVRVVNTLEAHNIIMADDLMKQTWASLMSMTNFGDKTFAEVRAAIRALGLEPPTWKAPPKPKPTPKPRGRGKSMLDLW